MKKQGMDMNKYTDEFIGSEGFKTQLDGMGYSDKNEQGNNTRDDDGSNRNQNGPPLATIMPIPTDAPNKSLDPETNKKSSEQPKVASQMDNTDVKSKLTPDDILLKNKRKGRKKTVLTSVTGVEGYPTLSRRTLLGG